VDFSSFKVISERNIFNPNRFVRTSTYRPRQSTRVVRRNSFALTGTMSYDQGESAGVYAFFDGSNTDFRKTLKADETIGVFKVAAITPDSVTLTRDTNTTVLKVGMQLRDDGAGNWSLTPELASLAGNSSVTDAMRGNRHGFGANSAADSSGTNNAEGNEADFAAGPGDGPPPGGMPEPPVEIAAPETVPTGPGSDALRRLMELRAQEEQQSGNRN